MTGVAVVAGVLVAAAGWIVNQVLARRALRRAMRIEYLLSAYRRLEGASNRAMTEGQEHELEAAISDIQLLGSPQQVAMASRFAKEFADTRRADSNPLLDDLRVSLRHELLLESVSTPRLVLRINGDASQPAGPSVTTSASAVWQEQEQRIVDNLGARRLPEHPVPESAFESVRGTSFARQMLDLAERASPAAAVAASHERVGEELRGVLGQADVGGLDSLGVTELAESARNQGLINQATFNAVNGLGVTRTSHS